MKSIISAATLLLSCSCNAFSPSISQTSLSQLSSSASISSSSTTHSAQLQMATITSDELNKISTSEQFKLLFDGKEYDDPYESKKLAMGIDPDEVLEFIGT